MVVDDQGSPSEEVPEASRTQAFEAQMDELRTLIDTENAAMGKVMVAIGLKK